MRLHLETLNGAAMVRGSFLGQGASECRSVSFIFTSDLYGEQGQCYGNRGNNVSKEQTIANGVLIFPRLYATHPSL